MAEHNNCFGGDILLNAHAHTQPGLLYILPLETERHGTNLAILHRRIEPHTGVLLEKGLGSELDDRMEKLIGVWAPVCVCVGLTVSHTLNMVLQTQPHTYTHLHHPSDLGHQLFSDM